MAKKEQEGTPVKSEFKAVKGTADNKYMEAGKVYQVHESVAARLVKAKKAVYADAADIA